MALRVKEEASYKIEAAKKDAFESTNDDRCVQSLKEERTRQGRRSLQCPSALGSADRPRHSVPVVAFTRYDRMNAEEKITAIQASK